ncbi:MAG: pilus assembly protein [Planctomycetales bacterium]|nr:pilus assembly protein [Planctomycetales bacterium]
MLPILAALVLGIIDWGYLFFTRQHMIQAAREGVRIRAAEGPTTSTSTTIAATENYLSRVNPRLANDFIVTMGGGTSGNAWVQVAVPKSAASITAGFLTFSNDNLVARVEMEYITN